MASESDGGLRKIFRDNLKEFDWQSIETGGTGQGVPDSNYCVDGTEGWIEYKFTDGYTCTLRPEQIGWHLRRARHGGITWIAVRRRSKGGPRSGPPCDELYMIEGRYAIQAKEQGLRGPGGLAWYVWSGGPSAWPWGVVGALLRIGRLAPADALPPPKGGRKQVRRGP